MISIKSLTKQINNGLNALAATSGFPFEFAIKSEGGEYEPPKRDGNNVTVYINGTTRILDSEVIPAQGVSVSTQTVQLEIAYPMPDDIKPEDAIAPVRELLNTYFAATSVQALPDANDKPFAVAMYATIPTTGEISQSTGPGLMCTFSCSLFYSFIEDGVNSGSVIMYFNGVQIPYMDANITRVPIMSATPYSNSNGAAKSVIESTALNIEFNAPTLQSLNNPLFTAYKKFLLTGQNSVYNVEIYYENKPETYKMSFGQIVLSLEGVKNGNSRITLIEANEF